MENTIKIENIASLGLAIRMRRKKLGLDQVTAAGLCNVGTRFLSDIENGKETAHIGLVLRVLRGLGFELSLSKKVFNK